MVYPLFPQYNDSPDGPWPSRKPQKREYPWRRDSSSSRGRFILNRQVNLLRDYKKSRQTDHDTFRARDSIVEPSRGDALNRVVNAELVCRATACFLGYGPVPTEGQ